MVTRRSTDISEDSADVARQAASRGGGGWLANLMALLAIAISGVSFYEAALRAPDLRLYVPPTIGFADPFNGPFDVFELPVTIANNGARPGVALSFELEVDNPNTGETKRYYASGLGAWKAAFAGDHTPFAPISVAGRAAETRRVIFQPRASETIDRHIEVEPGVYQFRLTLRPAEIDPPLPFWEQIFGDAPAKPIMLSFEMTSDGLDYRAFNDGGLIDLRRADYAPVVSD